jgi:2-keto-4-pentenoate hydratase/2-oxohepta-3-ene-1,7-dioic acid hydratase in catechol pathway
MRWVRYLSPTDRQVHVGLLEGEQVRGLAADIEMLDILAADRLTLAARSAAEFPFETLDASTAQLLSPIGTPPALRDFMSFEEHVVTSMSALGHTVSPVWYEQPTFYFSNPAAVIGPSDPVVISPGSAQFDFELEVAAIIGTECSNVRVEDAEHYIAGYTILCDWSARDLQEREMTVGLGPSKGKDSATTIGPALVTPDELEHLRQGKGYAIAMTAEVNGRRYSEGTWSTIHWSFAEMISFASRGTTLKPGDVLGSGTVGTGCILELGRVHGFDTYPYLVGDDDVKIDVDILGQLRTTIVADHSTPTHAEAVRGRNV